MDRDALWFMPTFLGIVNRSYPGQPLVVSSTPAKASKIRHRAQPARGLEDARLEQQERFVRAG